MDVTDVLRDRMQRPAGLQRMVTVSLLLHGVAIILLALAPKGFLAPSAAPPRSTMTISLGGGGDGPRTGGLTAIGGRPVQVQTPPEELPKREAVRPPAAKTPEMTVPLPKAKPLKAARPSAAVKNAPDEARGRTPTRGAEVQPGSAIAETRARGEGFGLSSGGAPGSGMTLDVGEFCCQEYLNTMVDRIQSHWLWNVGTNALVVVRFTIQRDGTLTQIALEKGHPNPALGLEALRAVQLTKQLPPLPSQFPNPTLTVHLNFQYQ
jgi:TonB family protein